MAEPGSEESYLDYLQSVFRRFKYLVSYNGRAFDVPLLRNRLILNRKAGLPEFLHFDLLHIFRRLLPKNAPKQGGKGYRQMDLEERLLDHRREDDLPGALIPQIYFDYVRYGHDGGMQKVFEHNLRDLSGMVLLFLEAIRIYDGRADARGALRAGLARILLRNRREEEALELLEGHVLADQGDVSVDEGRASIDAEQAAAEDDLPGGLRYRDLLLLAHLYRARGRFAQAAEIFARVVERYDCPYARMSLAKLLEHRLKNFAGALSQTEQLLERFVPAGNPEAAGGTGLYSRLELEKRRARIHRKIAN
jgi:hypothetical protein